MEKKSNRLKKIDLQSNTTIYPNPEVVIMVPQAEVGALITEVPQIDQPEAMSDEIPRI